ncbi:MAG: response regulator [Planctomycetota bacterium]
MSISVLVADDHEVVRTGLVRLLQGSEIDIVAEAENGEQALEQTMQHSPDVVLMDVRMPEGDGLVALEKIRAAKPDVRVVMLSTYDNPTYVARSVALGATDYVLKDSNREALITAITRAAAGEPPPENSLLHSVKETMDRLRERHDGGEIPLTNRELQVLRHVALGLSNREIGHSLEISIETVKEHVQNILRKVDAADRTQAAVWAIKKGFV